MTNEIDGVERERSQGMMIVFNAEETHIIRALDEKLVYIAIYKETPESHEGELEEQSNSMPVGAREIGTNIKFRW